MQKHLNTHIHILKKFWQDSDNNARAEELLARLELEETAKPLSAPPTPPADVTGAIDSALGALQVYHSVCMSVVLLVPCRRDVCVCVYVCLLCVSLSCVHVSAYTSVSW